jgi:predicted O-methyltransferase YrrM
VSDAVAGHRRVAVGRGFWECRFVHPDTWNSVDRFLADALHAKDPVLDAVLAGNAREGLPSIDVSATQGKLLYLLARMQGARRILEFGTLGGYSTIWLARALPADGLLVTLEADPKHARVARENLERAGVGDRVRIREGRALETLPGVRAEFPGAFDLVFVDADKPNTAEYFAWALELSRPGTVIVVDNVVRKGAVTNAESNDPNVQGMRRFLERISREPRVEATAVQTVGTKGYDGFVMARVKG